MKKRIFGLETEFGLALTSRGRGALPVSRVVPYLFAKFNTPADFWNVFLENGARFYLDTGSHPEYAERPAVFGSGVAEGVPRAGTSLLQ